MEAFIIYFACWCIASLAIAVIFSELYSMVNQKLEKRNCRMKKKKISSYQKWYVESRTGRKYFLPEISMYNICRRLNKTICISLVINICVLVIGMILLYTVMENASLFIIIHSSVFGAFYLAMIIISIVTLRKAFKSCPKE